MLYQDKTDPTVLANEVGVLDFEIRSRPDEGEREKIPRQLIRASRYIDQQYDDISLTRIEVVVPADENIPESVFMATSPEWKIEEGILIHTLKPVAKFSCN